MILQLNLKFFYNLNLILKSFNNLKKVKILNNFLIIPKVFN